MNNSIKPIYRVKTEEEIKRLIGENYIYILGEEYSWDYPVMNYLFGKYLNITENDIKNADYDHNDNKYYILVNIPDKNDRFKKSRWWISTDLIKTIKPSYKPREILRESYYDQNYLPFVVWCDSKEKSNEFEKFLHKNDWFWGPDKQEWLSRTYINEPQTFVHFNFKNKTFDSYSGVKQFTNFKQFTYPNDLEKIKSYIIHGTDIPSYKPRKILRESINIAKKNIELKQKKN